MKRMLIAIVAASTVLSFAGIASAIPVSDNPKAAAEVLEGQNPGTQPAQPVKKPVKKHKRVRKHQKKHAAPASSQAPALSGAATRPEASPSETK
jgi:hypothetical protein